VLILAPPTENLFGLPTSFGFDAQLVFLQGFLFQGFHAIPDIPISTTTIVHHFYTKDPL